MNTQLKGGLLFAGGLGTGLAIGILSTMQYFKKKYSDIATNQINEMEAYYQKTDTYARGGYDIAEDNAEVNPVEESNTSRAEGILDPATREEIRAKLLKNHEIVTNYTSMYNDKGEKIDSEKETKVKDFFREAEAREDTEEEMTPEEQATSDHIEHRNDPPKIISLEEFDGLPPYVDRRTVYLYDLDEVVVDDNDEVLEDSSVLLGNCLDDFIDSDNDMLFVYNAGMDAAFEVQRVSGRAYYSNV